MWYQTSYAAHERRSRTEERLGQKHDNDDPQ